MFKLVVETKNAAFEPEPAEEVIRILEETIRKLRDGSRVGTIRDVNGNKVGTYSLSKGR